MKFNLPKDLTPFEISKSKTILRVVLRVLLGAAAAALGYFIGLFIGRYMPDGSAARIVVRIVIAALFAAVMIKALFFDKAPDVTCAGTIEDVKVRTKTKSETPEKPTIETLYTVCSIELFVRSPDNAARWINAATYKSKDIEQNKIEKFKVGAEVFHLCGTKTSVIFPTDSDNTVTCAVCGRSNPKGNDVCDKCGHTLIKSIQQIT